MEFNLSSFSIIATIFFITAISILLRFINTKSLNREPPKAKGALPIIGHLHLLGSRPAHHVISDMADKYGPIFTMKLGVHQTLVVSSGEIAKEIHTTNDKIFASRPKLKAAEIMGYDYAVVGFAPFGDYYRKVRKMLMMKVLSQKRVEMLEHIRVAEVKASMRDIYEAWLKNKESEGTDMVKVDMSGWVRNLTLSVIYRVLSGKTLRTNHQDGIRSKKVIRSFFELLGKFVVSDYIPLLDAFDLGGYKKKMKMVAKEMDDIFEDLLKEHRGEKDHSGKQLQDESNQVFIDVMISILQDASEEDFSGYDHDTIIKSSCLAILVGASDTTSVTIVWALSLLLNNPKTMKIVQDEIDEHVGRERLIEHSDAKKLVYLQAVIKETLRLYPAAPLSFPHESTEDCIVSGYNIPKGTRLFVNISKLQRDPKVWLDPHKFQPERFLTSHKDVDLKGNHFELIPFSSGRRVCPGIFFSLEAIRFILASVLQQFIIKKPSDEPIDMTEGIGLATTRATPLQVSVAPRLSPNMYSV